MKNKIILLLSFILTLILTSCTTKTSCDQLSNQFSSYDEAISKIKSADFKINETANTSKSSWIKNASFFSCDSNTGYFILETFKQEYLYSELPYSLWKEFKSAESFGSYYNQKIKNNYIFLLSK